jgi:dephospho-CoA kinase
LRAKLNEITHPAIRFAWQRELEERTRTHPSQPLAVMIPLLFECELESCFAAVWAVGASRETQLRRLQGRGISDLEAGQRIQSQLPVAEKMNRASLAFWGEGPVTALLSQLDQIQLP